MLARFRSPVVITSILSLVFLILTNLEVIDIGSETVQNIINAVITILIGFGVLNNPTDKTHF